MLKLSIWNVDLSALILIIFWLVHSGDIRRIFASLIFKSKIEHLQNVFILL